MEGIVTLAALAAVSAGFVFSPAVSPKPEVKSGGHAVVVGAGVRHTSGREPRLADTSLFYHRRANSAHGGVPYWAAAAFSSNAENAGN